MSKSESSSNQMVGLAKYRGLVALIVLFLLLTVGMLASSVYVTNEQSNYAKEVMAATRQSRLVQQLSKAAFDLDLYMDDALMAQENTSESGSVALDKLPQEALYTLDELKTARNQFEETLSAFENGGMVSFTYEDIKLRQLNRSAEKEKLAQIRRTWNPYLGLIDAYIAEATSGYVNKQTTQYLVDYARLYNLSLMTATIDINQMVRDDLEANTVFWNRIQFAGIVAAFVLFAGIVFGALRQLVANDKQLAVANQEMSEIMSSVNEGLFLVNKDLDIAGHYSASLEKILGQSDLGSKNLLDVLDKLVPESEIETTKVFIEQLYSDWVEVDLIEDLNPLHRISVQDDNGALKFLDFKFFRVWLNGAIERVLVSVQDTTETVLLQASLDAQKEQEGRELEMLNIILNTNQMVLNNFISGSMARLNDINEVLKSPDNNRAELRSKVQYIARLIHSIKGEASSLKLHRMVDICETFEESLNTMRHSSNLTGQDFLGLVVLLEDLYRLFDVLENYSARVKGDDETAAAPQNPEQNARALAQSQEQYLKDFVRDMAQRAGKKAELTVSGFSSSHISQAQWLKLKDIAIQLLRNSVIHGIETPDIRAQRNKPEVGSLKLTLSEQANGQIMLTAEDDGNGIDFNAIRAKAVALGMANADEHLEQRQLLNFMFSSGLSTAKEQTEDAGRGVGMDIIKATIHEMGGKIGVATAPESYTRFNMTFPKE